MRESYKKGSFCPFCNNYKFIFKENNMEKMTQEKAVLLHLQTKGSLTQAQAVRLYGCYRLSAKILEFRKQGYNIETQYKTGKTRYGTHTTYANYILQK